MPTLKLSMNRLPNPGWTTPLTGSIGLYRRETLIAHNLDEEEDDTPIEEFEDDELEEEEEFEDDEEEQDDAEEDLEEEEDL